METPIITAADADSHVLGLLLALADRPPGWHGLGIVDFDGNHDRDWRRYAGSVARLAADAGLAERRRGPDGVQVRLTDAGRARVEESEKIFPG